MNPSRFSVETLEVSYDCVIPSAMFFNKNLEPAAIKCYAIIRNLAREDGYCYASNEYLATLLECDERSVRRWICSLKKEGFLEVHTEKNGIVWHRHLYISDKFKKCLRKVKNVRPPGQNCPPPRTKLSTYIEDKSNGRKEEREGAPPPPPPPSFFTFNRVKIEHPKYEKLVQEFGKAKIDQMVERLDEYADINPKRFNQYACHAAVIRKWVREDREKFPQKEPDFEKNRQSAEAREEKLKGVLPPGCVWKVEKNCVVVKINRINLEEKIWFKDPAHVFAQQANALVQKLKNEYEYANGPVSEGDEFLKNHLKTG